ncbi:laccase domain-containing protein [Actinomyces bowdenii]|uniref:polyphenol oxidase family protein n=1 Tax=Actinomyces bowdenii TaxID=131109 RepID=UPI001ABC7351|nr:laccase domain-containing protein [Actinomyces bowdenii]
MSLSRGGADLLEADLGPGAHGWFTTRGAGAQAPPSAGADRPGPYAGWNLADHVGDDPARVQAHRRGLEGALGLGPDRHLAWMNQVHSAVVAQAVADATPTADALLLRAAPGAPAGVCVMAADCVPLLLASGDGAIVCGVHAGRRGMLDGVVTAAIGAMVRAGARPEDLWAAVGPSICGSCYEVPEQMLHESAQREPACASQTRWGAPGLDVAAGVLAQLERAGVAHVQSGGWCTMEDPRFFSYRRDGITGRHAAVALPAR